MKILENVKVEKLVFGGTGLATAEDGRKILISGGVIPEAIVDIRILKIKKKSYRGTSGANSEKISI